MITDFLKHLGDVARSPLAFAGYVLVVFAWCFWMWLRFQLQGKFDKIFTQFDSDAGRNEGLGEFGKLVGISPPQGLPRKDLMRWATLQMRHRLRVIATVAYLSTLIAVIVIVCIAKFQPAPPDERKPPVLVDYEVVK